MWGSGRRKKGDWCISELSLLFEPFRRDKIALEVRVGLSESFPENVVGWSVENRRGRGRKSVGSFRLLCHRGQIVKIRGEASGQSNRTMVESERGKRGSK